MSNPPRCLDPRDGRLFYAVQTQREGSRWTEWVDATSGEVRNRLDAVAKGTGTGIKGDEKQIDTTKANGSWRLVSRDRRQKTCDAGNLKTLPGTLMTDADNVWDLSQPVTVSPSQAATSTSWGPKRATTTSSSTTHAVASWPATTPRTRCPAV